MEYLNSRSTGLKSKNELVLLSRKLGVDLDHSAAISNGLVDVGLGDGNLLLVLLLVLTKLGALEVGLNAPKFQISSIFTKFALFLQPYIQIWSHFQVLASK